MVLGCQGSEDSTSDSKIRGAHMRAFLDVFKGKRNSTEILCVHGPMLRSSQHVILRQVDEPVVIEL